MLPDYLIVHIFHKTLIIGTSFSWGSDLGTSAFFNLLFSCALNSCLGWLFRGFLGLRSWLWHFSYLYKLVNFSLLKSMFRGKWRCGACSNSMPNNTTFSCAALRFQMYCTMYILIYVTSQQSQGVSSCCV